MEPSCTFFSNFILFSHVCWASRGVLVCQNECVDRSCEGSGRFQVAPDSTVFDIALTAKALSGLRMRPAGPWGQEGLRGLRDRRWDRLSC